MMGRKASAPWDDEAGVAYEIKIQGQLEKYWSDCLGGLEISQDSDGNTLLTGVIPDQAALHGILAQIRDLGLILISLASMSVRMGEEEDSGIWSGQDR